jgi:hypothetical protein
MGFKALIVNLLEIFSLSKINFQTLNIGEEKRLATTLGETKRFVLRLYM